MGKVTILNYTNLNPLEMIGHMAGICYNSNITDTGKNVARGKKCLETQHGRTLEFPDVYMKIEGYSARVIREWYTHIGGSPTRLQASTRYIDYGDFEYIIPEKIKHDEYFDMVYKNTMRQISDGIGTLMSFGCTKEDVANLLPLGMTTTIVCKHNLRNLIDMSHQRMCSRAYKEYRELFSDVCDALSEYSDEWNYIVEKYFIPKCFYLNRCPEKHPCGKFDWRANEQESK